MKQKMPAQIYRALGFCFLLALGTTSEAGSEWLRLPYGVTRNGTVLESEVHPSLLDVSSRLTRVLVIAGAETDPAALRATAARIESMRAATQAWSIQFPETSVSLIASLHPAGLAVEPSFPPQGKAYDDPVEPETIYLWRWLGMLAPDVVVELRAGNSAAWKTPKTDRDLFSFESLNAQQEDQYGGLASALAKQKACGVASIPALSLRASSDDDLLPLLKELSRQPVRSPARQELQRRLNRSPLEVAQELSRVYGRQLDEVTYIPALSLVARLRLGELMGDASHRGEVERLVSAYHTGEKTALPAKSNGSQQAGHLIFGELAGLTNDARYRELLRRPADIGFDANGLMLDAMPAHAEMSDAVFLGTPLLAQAARLSGDSNYREMALRHLRFMVKLNQRPDGLHRHSPVASDQTAWGRGNGFVALGLALTLSELPETGSEFQEVLKLYRNHLDAMRPHQDVLGMWHQVIDHPESYREFTVTCMTTFAITRGLRRGWLDRVTYEPVVQRAWQSIKKRTAPDGGLVDVCAGTGKMKSLREYLDRPAILGRDDRGGAMAFLLCTELALADREKMVLVE